MIVLAIDMQKGITDDRLYNFRSFRSRIKEILYTARKNHVEIIHFQHDDGEGSGFSMGDWDFEISDIVEYQEGEKIFIKTQNSCFSNKEFKEYLKQKKEDSILVIGLQTNYCIDATIHSAFDLGYKVYIPMEGNTTFANEYMTGEQTYRYYNELIWNHRFGELISLEEAKRLLGE